MLKLEEVWSVVITEGTGLEGELSKSEESQKMAHELKVLELRRPNGNFASQVTVLNEHFAPFFPRIYACFCMSHFPLVLSISCFQVF